MRHEDLTAEIRRTLVQAPEGINVDGIAEAIREEYGDIRSLDEVPTEDYWEIVKAYDASPVEDEEAGA